MRFFKKIAVFIFCIYLAPSIASAALWAARSHPENWREADWSSTHILPDPKLDPEARIVVFSASTGGFKGAFAVHSWIVLRKEGQPHYDRYDVVGWGKPVRKNHYAADGRWYSNMPEKVIEISGPQAQRLIPRIEAAIKAYPHDRKGAYVLWPGPNSNTFIATILRAVPEIGAVLPPNAVGRDYLASGPMVSVDAITGDLHVTLSGLFGFSAGRTSGLEMHFMGLVAGLDLANPGIKVPAFGRLGV
jgi:hypothetical protein